MIFLVVSWATNKAFAYPLTTNNMYVWEIVTIGGGGLFLSLQPSKEQLKGSYLRNVLSKSAPGGIVCVFAVCVYFLDLQRLILRSGEWSRKNAAQTLSVITFTALSFCVLFRVSLPFDNYRTSSLWQCFFFAVLVLFPRHLFHGDQSDPRVGKSSSASPISGHPIADAARRHHVRGSHRCLFPLGLGKSTYCPQWRTKQIRRINTL
jgi:hypothetical protein